MKRDPNKYPKGWNRRRVEAVITHFEGQSDREAIAEADAALVNADFALIPVPIELAAEVRKLIASRTGKGERPNRKSA